MEIPAGTPTKLPTLGEWRIYLRGRGIEELVVKKYIEYIRPLVKVGVPVIFDLTHLCSLLGRTTTFVVKAAVSPSDFYRSFSIPKRSGGVRNLDAPYPSLKECQHWISREILARIPVGPSCVGYVKGRSILDHVRPHCFPESEILIVDVKDFFPSLGRGLVLKFFEKLGYNAEVAWVLSGLCCLDEHLPQGAPTSSTLSNLLLSELDKRLAALAEGKGANYTRYADDLCFSSQAIDSTLAKKVFTELYRLRLLPNEAKVRHYPKNASRKIITGVCVESGMLKLPKSTRRELVQTVYFIEKFGFASHAAKLKIKDEYYLKRLRGRLEFWRFVEKNNETAMHCLEVVKGVERSGWGLQ